MRWRRTRIPRLWLPTTRSFSVPMKASGASLSYRCMRRFLLALVVAAIAISRGASHGNDSGSSAGPIARREPRTYHGEAGSEAPNRFTDRTSRTCAARATPDPLRRAAPPASAMRMAGSCGPAGHAAFQSSHPCPATGRTSGACPGYVVDHIVPLKRGGADEPSNMNARGEITRGPCRLKRSGADEPPTCSGK